MKHGKKILLLILFLAFFLRVWQLDRIPIELFGDEIDAGLQAYSILKTGKDYFSHSFPIMFQSFTEYRLPALIYSISISVGFLGLNEWGVRMPSVIFGVLSVFGLYLLTKKLFEQRTALIAAFFLAILPWHLHFTRQANDASTILPFVIFAVWAFLSGLKDFRMMVLSVFLFGLTVYCYQIAALFTPLFLLSLLLIFRKDLKKTGFKKLIFVAMVFLLTLTPYLILIWKGDASKRFSSISIFSNNAVSDEIILRRVNEDKKEGLIFHNKPTAYFYELSENYLRSFSPDFLFFSGDPNLRNSVGNKGELYFFQLFLITAGFFAFSSFKKKNIYLVFSWMLISPLPSALTHEGGYHAGRLVVLLVPLLILSSIGLGSLMDNFHKKKVKFFLLLLFILASLDVSFYFHRYYSEWSKDSFRFWQFGYREAMNYIKENDKNYSRIFFNNTYEPAFPRFLFYYKFSPQQLQNHISKLDAKKDVVTGFNGFGFMDRYYFGIVGKLIKDEGFAELLSPEDLYLVSVKDEVGSDDWISNPPPHLKILKRIYSPFNKPIFFIVTKKV